jgi:outer membrane protein OmpA-like peptidoglycan-associated protein
VRALLAAAALLAGAAQAATDELRFITCPIYRDADAGRKSGCWLADDLASGTRYDVSLAPSKPDWNREVLVEGRVAATPGESACGGIVLDAVRTSVLEAPCPRHMLPAEGFPGRRFVLPARNIQPLAIARTPPPGPFTNRSFHLFYDFDRDFLIYQYDDYLLDQAVAWIRAARPKRIVVTGWAATEGSDVSGRSIAESPEIARSRAEAIAESLYRLGVSREIVDVRWRRDAKPLAVPEADGLTEPSRRRVDIDVEMPA